MSWKSVGCRRASRWSWWAGCWAREAGSRARAPTWRAGKRSRSWSRCWAATPAAWCWSPASCAAGQARRCHDGRWPDHGRVARAVPGRPPAKPLRQRRAFPAQAAARALPSCRPLGVFHGGGHIGAIAWSWGSTGAGRGRILAQALVDVGLAERLEYGYLRFDPRWDRSWFASWMSRRERPPRPAGRRQRISSRVSLRPANSDPQMAATLTLHELPNLLAALSGLAGRGERRDRRRISDRPGELGGEPASNLGLPRGSQRRGCGTRASGDVL